MFASIARHFRKMISLYIILGVACAAAAVLSVWLFQRLVDGLTTEPDFTRLLPLLVAYGVAGLMEYLLNYADEYPINQLMNGIYQYIKASALKKVSRIDYTAYQDIGTGTLVQLVENGAAAGRDIFFGFYLRIIAQLAPGVLFSIAFMGVYDLRVMLGALSGYVVVFLVTKLLLQKLYAIKEETLLSEEWLSKAYVRAFMELVIFRVNRRFAHELERVTAVGKQITDANTRMKIVHEFFFAAFAILVLIIKVVMIAASVSLIANGGMSIGVLLALLTLTDKLYQPIAIFNVIYVDYKLNRVAYDRFDRFLNLPDDPNLTGGAEAKLSGGEIRVEDVSFGYGGLAILKGVTLTVPAGSFTALVGSSGAGKSTLAKLVMGLIKPQSGRILADGQDLTRVDLNSYYRHIAYVSQDAPIFDGTLRENICFGQEEDERKLRQILAKARLLALVDSLEMGLETPVGEHGVKLSGGEKQRLAFARVLYQQPEVVILDEPTSALDQRTERDVIDAMLDSLRGRTVIAIAHRLSTIREADQIVVLDGGGIAEQGTHAQLEAAGGIYAAMVAGDALRREG